MLPIPVVDDKSFKEIVEDALRLIPQFSPKWTDYNAHDPGITFVELLAWLTEMQHYYMDQVGKRNYMKFLRLLGSNFRPREAVPAKVDVTFTLPEDSEDLSLVIPKETRLQAGEVIFETVDDIRLNNAKLKKIFTYVAGDISDNTDVNQRIGLSYYAFGKKASKGSRLYLCFDKCPAELTLTVYFFQDYPEERISSKEQPDIIPTAKVKWEYKYMTKNWNVNNDSDVGYQDLRFVEGKLDETLGFMRSGRIYLSLPDSVPGKDKELWLRCTVVQDGYESPPRISNISFNTIEAVQQESLCEIKNKGNGLPEQKIILQRVPVISKSFELKVIEKDGDGTAITNQWDRVDDFDASKPNDRHFVLDPETGEVMFGDGVNGAIPPAPAVEEDDNIVILYKAGGGEKGNVKAGAVNKLSCPRDSNMAVVSVENCLPAVGGIEAETLEQAKARALKELNSVSRAVTFVDFEKLACTTPGLRVARAKAYMEKDGEVKVVVIPCSETPRPTPGQGFLETVFRHLDRHRLVTTKVEVLPPQYIAINVYATIGIKPRYEPVAARNRIQEGLEKFFNPLSGGTEGIGWPFGRKVYKSELYQLIEKIEGVDFIKELTFTGQGENDNLMNQLVYLGESKVNIIIPGGGCSGKEVG